MIGSSGAAMFAFYSPYWMRGERARSHLDKRGQNGDGGPVGVQNATIYSDGGSVALDAGRAKAFWSTVGLNSTSVMRVTPV